MILQLNHLQRTPAAASAQEVVDTFYSLLEEGHLEQDQFAHQFIWIGFSTGRISVSA